MPHDFAAAAKWYRKADQNFPNALLNLGFTYADGRGVRRGNLQAYVWFNLAAARCPHRMLKNASWRTGPATWWPRN